MERKEKITAQRWIMFAIGMYLFGAGIAITIKAAIGVTPLSGVTTILNKIFPAISIGTFSFGVNASFLLCQYLFEPKSFKTKNFMQIIPVFLTSVFIDLNMWIFSFINPQSYVSALITLLVGCVVQGVCFALLVRAGIILMPIETFISLLARRFNKSWGICKIWMDVSMVILTIIISLIAYRRIEVIREGTLISALLVGRITQFTQLGMDRAFAFPQNVTSKE